MHQKFVDRLSEQVDGISMSMVVEAVGVPLLQAGGAGLLGYAVSEGSMVSFWIGLAVFIGSLLVIYMLARRNSRLHQTENDTVVARYRRNTAIGAASVSMLGGVVAAALLVFS